MKTFGMKQGESLITGTTAVALSNMSFCNRYFGRIHLIKKWRVRKKELVQALYKNIIGKEGKEQGKQGMGKDWLK